MNNLSDILNYQIEQNGGIDKTILLICKEWPELFGIKQGNRGVFTYVNYTEKKPFTNSDNEFIKQSWQELTLQQISDRLDRSKSSISRQGYKIGCVNRLYFNKK